MFAETNGADLGHDLVASLASNVVAARGTGHVAGPLTAFARTSKSSSQAAHAEITSSRKDDAVAELRAASTGALAGGCPIESPGPSLRSHSRTLSNLKMLDISDRFRAAA